MVPSQRWRPVKETKGGGQEVGTNTHTGTPTRGCTPTQTLTATWKEKGWNQIQLLFISINGAPLLLLR